MKLHRFYVPDTELKHDFWLHDERLINQWRRVLRFQSGQELVLFDGTGEDRLYKLGELTEREAHVQLVTELKRQVPAREVYLLWALLKKDKNDWVLQKCTELGVRHFVPLLTERTEKTGFDVERAKKIVIEAAEQCGRSDIPAVREPLTLETAVQEFDGKVPLLVCEQGETETHTDLEQVGVLIGPEGGWSEREKGLFETYHLPSLNLHDFTLRAETACIAAVTKLVQ